MMRCQVNSSFLKIAFKNSASFFSERPTATITTRISTSATGYHEHSAKHQIRVIIFWLPESSLRFLWIIFSCPAYDPALPRGPQVVQAPLSVYCCLVFFFVIGFVILVYRSYQWRHQWSPEKKVQKGLTYFLNYFWQPILQFYAWRTDWFKYLQSFLLGR